MKNTLILLCLLLPVICFAQDRKSLEERADKIYRYHCQRKTDSLTEMIDPDVFKIITKEKYIRDLNDNSRDDITTSPVHIPPNFYFGEIKKVGEDYYCIYYHDYTLKAAFNNELSKLESDFLVEYAKKRIKADKVVFNTRMNAVLLLTRIRSIAVAYKKNNYVWYFDPIIKDRNITEQLGL